MTQTFAKGCWPRGKEPKKVSGGLSLAPMVKTKKFSKAYSSGFDMDCRHAVEAVDESLGFVSPVHVGSEDSCAPKRRCISLNPDNGFFVPMQVIRLSKLSGSERKELEVRFRRELELVQKLQKKLLSCTALLPTGSADWSSCDPLVKKKDFTNQNISQMKRGAGGRFESKKQLTQTSATALMKQCETLLKRLLGHQYGWIFGEPVDVVKLNIPDYFTVIKKPMDFGTIQSKLTSSFYNSPMDFASDVRLTFSNAMKYNPPGNDAHLMADAMSKFFELRWKPIEKKLSANISVPLKMETGATKTSPHLKKRKISQDHNLIVLDSKAKMTDEEKLSLSRRLSLISELPQYIIDFLKRHTDNAGQNNEDEIEIDFDSLSTDTLFELKELLDNYSKRNHLEKHPKTEPCEIEILNESGLSNSSMHLCKENAPAAEDEDVDIGDNEPLMMNHFPVESANNGAPRSISSSSSSSSSESESSSTDSESDNSSRNRSNMKDSGFSNEIKDKGPQKTPSPGKAPASSAQLEQGAHLKTNFAKPSSSQRGENAPSERQVSPDKLYRAAVLKSRFADTILKAREKTFDQSEKKDPEKLRKEREELEKQQRDEKARLQAEAKAAEDARRQAEERAAAEAKRKRQLEREAAREALLKVEKTVEINECNLFLKDLEMLRTVPGKHIMHGSPNEGILDLSNEGMDDFKLGGSNPLEQLGLYMKADDDEEEDCDAPIYMPDVEEGEID